MFNRLLLQYNRNKNKSNYGDNSLNYYELENNNKKCITGRLSKIINFA